MKAIRTNRSGLFLIEMVIVILFFAVTAAICVRLFSAAALTSRDSTVLSRAVLITQSAAETVKACSGDGEAFSEALSAGYDGEAYVVFYDSECKPQPADLPGEASYMLTVTPKSGGDGLLEFRAAFIKLSDGSEVFGLDSAVYTGRGNG